MYFGPLTVLMLSARLHTKNVAQKYMLIELLCMVYTPARRAEACGHVCHLGPHFAELILYTALDSSISVGLIMFTAVWFDNLQTKFSFSRDGMLSTVFNFISTGMSIWPITKLGRDLTVQKLQPKTSHLSTSRTHDKTNWGPNQLATHIWQGGAMYGHSYIDQISRSFTIPLERTYICGLPKLQRYLNTF